MAHTSAAIELLPGELSADVVLRDVSIPGAELQCWSAITRGLRRVGQTEVAITLPRTSDDALEYPETILEYFRAMRDFATQGRVVSDGGMSGFRSPGPFQIGRFVAVLFACNPSLGPTFDPNLLHGVLVTEPEFEMAVGAGPNRVLSALGRLYRYFPWPYWSDPNRPEVFGPDSLDATFVAQTGHMYCPTAFATTARNSVYATIPGWAATKVGELLAASDVATLTMGREPGIQAAFAWMPGDAEPTAIHAVGDDGSRIATWFLMFIPSDAEADEVDRREDGVTIVLSSKTRAELTNALEAGSSISVAGGSAGMDLTIVVVADQAGFDT